MTQGRCTSANELKQALAAAVEMFLLISANAATAEAAFGLGCCELIDRCGLKLVAACALLDEELRRLNIPRPGG